MMDGQPTNLGEAVEDLCGQQNVEATHASIQMDFVYELVKQYPLLLLEYVAEQNEMTITAESSVRFSSSR
jgi:hypothetical protein